MRSWRLYLVLLFFSLGLGGCTVPQFWKSTAGLQVLTPNVPASLYLDDEYLEKTPFLRKDLTPQTYTLKIVPDDPDLVEYQTSITLHPKTLSVVTWNPRERPETSGGVTYELEKLSGKQTQFSLITIPDRGLVSIDGGNTEFAPILVENINPGEHAYSVTIPSYETHKHTVQLVAGYRLNATVKLAQQTGQGSAGQNAGQALTNPLLASTSGQLDATGSAIASGSAAASASGAVANQVTIQPTNFFQGGKEVLRVRDEPSAEGIEIGIVEVGQIYPYLGEVKAGWYKIMFEGKTGWVSGSFVKLTE